VQALGGGGSVNGHVSPRVADAMREAYVYALGNGLRVGAGIAVLGAAFALALVARRPVPPQDAAPETLGAAAGTPAAEGARGELAREPVGA
jgi:hypothetical protein